MPISVSFFLLLVMSLPLMAKSSSSVMCGGSIMCPIGTPCKSESITCTENSFCDEESGVCICSPGFKETSYHLCLLDHQSDCSVYACNEEAQLICNRSNSECECALRGTHYSIPQGKCVANAGTDCSKTFGCTDNAFCNSEMDWKCYCRGGFTQTSTGRCLLGFDRACNSSIPEGDEQDYLYTCNSDAFLSCDEISEKCVCANDTELIYDVELEECVSLVGGQCDYKVTVEYTKVLKCVQGSECVANGQRGICRCPNWKVLDEESRTCLNNSNKYQSNYFFIFPFVIFIRKLTS